MIFDTIRVCCCGCRCRISPIKMILYMVSTRQQSDLFDNASLVSNSASRGLWRQTRRKSALDRDRGFVLAAERYNDSCSAQKVTRSAIVA